jgi:hypothetical protein
MMLYDVFCNVHVLYMWCSKMYFYDVHVVNMGWSMKYFVMFTWYTCDVIWGFLCSNGIHVILYDVLCDIHIIYLWYSHSIHMMFYDGFCDVHLVYMWCSIVSFTKYTYFIYLFIYLFIYFYVYYNTNFMNLKLEYCSSKPRTFLLRRRNIVIWI